MSDSILWYVHDHGTGHLQRARAVIPMMDSRVIVAAGPGVYAAAAEAFGESAIALPSDVSPHRTETVGPWHYAPSAPAVRARGAAFAAAVLEHGCTTAVVDVSVETTVLARLLGLRVIAVRQSGVRTDAAHRIGFASADAVWVPQHQDLEPIGDEARCDPARWHFTGAFSRFDGRRAVERSGAIFGPRGGEGDDDGGHHDDGDFAVVSGSRHAVLLLGGGGNSLVMDAWRDARPPDGWRVTIVGSPHRWSNGTCARSAGSATCSRCCVTPSVVVASAGWAAVADVAAAGSRLVAIAEDRPFDEQLVRATALAANGLAISLSRWPSPAELGGLVERAAFLDPHRWSAFSDGSGAARAAALIEGVHTR